MTDLIQQIEAARGPDRDLDGAIWIAIGGIDKRRVDTWQSPPCYPLAEYLRMAAPRFTSSLDAAQRVVPGWFWRVGHGTVNPGWAHLNRHHPDHCDTKDEVTAYAATPELALCAAGLKARNNELKATDSDSPSRRD